MFECALYYSGINISYSCRMFTYYHYTHKSCFEEIDLVLVQYLVGCRGCIHCFVGLSSSISSWATTSLNGKDSDSSLIVLQHLVSLIPDLIFLKI